MSEETPPIGVDFFPDWGHRLPLWDGGTLPPLSEALLDDLRSWVRTWQIVLDPVSEVRWPDDEVGRAWIAEGHRLVAAVEAELGAGYVLKHDFDMYGPDHDHTSL
ncbi:hypothetical protein [Microbacterium suwonense]|uniref:Uncharacterized protein n=1 Tax=Microbacterium suwonense TaxID=683047 RepID=A0ABN6X6E8_9MICO|nr:hypothetical protein [Microbacterium suwonense]BDZ40271.1 hypothetical protein GCM10025863_28850 [Microbacterium suwonense]